MIVKMGYFAHGIPITSKQIFPPITIELGVLGCLTSITSHKRKAIE